MIEEKQDVSRNIGVIVLWIYFDKNSFHLCALFMNCIINAKKKKIDCFFFVPNIPCRQNSRRHYSWTKETEKTVAFDLDFCAEKFSRRESFEWFIHVCPCEILARKIDKKGRGNRWKWVTRYTPTKERLNDKSA